MIPFVLKRVQRWQEKSGLPISWNAQPHDSVLGSSVVRHCIDNLLLPPPSPPPPRERRRNKDCGMIGVVNTTEQHAHPNCATKQPGLQDWGWAAPHRVVLLYAEGGGPLSSHSKDCAIPPRHRQNGQRIPPLGHKNTFHTFVQGFVVGSAKGSVCFYEREEDGVYKSVHTMELEAGRCVRSLLSLSEEAVAAISGGGQLQKISLAVGKNKVPSVPPHSNDKRLQVNLRIADFNREVSSPLILNHLLPTSYKFNPPPSLLQPPPSLLQLLGICCILKFDVYKRSYSSLSMKEFLLSSPPPTFSVRRAHSAFLLLLPAHSYILDSHTREGRGGGGG